MVMAGVVVEPGTAMAVAYRAIVIGIDDYQDNDLLPDLHGAVNDAEGLAKTFGDLQFTEVTLLVDAAARRKAFRDAWRRTLGASAAGDVIFLTYAGHGMQMVAADEASEADALDEFLPLAGFSRSRPGNREFLLDNEFNALIRRAGRKGVSVVMVIDACHSGTSFRSVDRRAAPRYRFSPVILERGTLGPVAPLATRGPADEPGDGAAEVSTGAVPENLISFGGATDGTLVPEVNLPDETGAMQSHGALSYFFARGLQGAADADGDGTVRFDEMAHYLSWNIDVVTAGTQRPRFVTNEAGAERALARPGRGHRVVPMAADAAIRVAVLGRGRGSSSVRGAEIGAVADRGTADLIWDPETGEVISGLDTIVAYDVDADGLQGVVDRRRARNGLIMLGESASLTVEALPEKPLYEEGEVVTLSVEILDLPYLVLFDIANDGTVQFLYPYEDGEDAPLDTGTPYRIEDVAVTGPFGADLLVAVTTRSPLAPMVAALAALDGVRDPMAALAVLRRWLPRTKYRLGMLSFYTCRPETGPC